MDSWSAAIWGKDHRGRNDGATMAQRGRARTAPAQATVWSVADGSLILRRIWA